MNTIPFPGHRKRKCALAVVAVAVLCTAATWTVTWCTTDFEVSPAIARHVLSSPSATSADFEALQRAAIISIGDEMVDSANMLAEVAKDGPNAEQARAYMRHIEKIAQQALK